MKEFLVMIAVAISGFMQDGRTAEKFTTDEVPAKVASIAEARVSVATAPDEVRRKKREKEEKELLEKAGVTVDGYGWIKLEYSEPYDVMDGHLTRSNGSIRCFGHRETWYSTNEGAGKTTARDIPGKHVAKDGTIRDEDGFICVASSDHKFYSTVMTSVGPGKVYDCGCSHGTVDVYTTW